MDKAFSDDNMTKIRMDIMIPTKNKHMLLQLNINKYG